MSNPYSTTKAAFHLDRINDLRSGRQIAPVHVQMILSAFCQQGCHFCAYRWEGHESNQRFAVIEPDGTRNSNPRLFMPFEKSIEIIEDCKSLGVKAIQFTGGGEPTLHKDWLSIAQAAAFRGLDISLVTNGVALDEESLEFLAMNATWVRFSFDAALAATYARIRRTSEAQYHRAVTHLLDLELLKRIHKSDVTIGVGFVVTKENYREVVAAAEVASDWGVDNFRISAVFQPGEADYFRDFHDEAASICRAAEECSTEKFKVINNFGDRISDLVLGSPDYPVCYQQQFATYISERLDVYRCCNTAYNDRGYIGNLQNQRFADLWESHAKQSDFNSFDARGCTRCQFNAQNRAIAELVEQPAHVNFV